MSVSIPAATNEEDSCMPDGPYIDAPETYELELEFSRDSRWMTPSIAVRLGFTASDRAANLRRAALIASEVVRHGGIVVCSFIAPYEQSRVEMRKAVEQYGSFILVHVSTPLAECERRDPKGMYRKARSGQIQTFTGVSDCYEAPSTCELRIDTMNTTVDEVVDEVTRQIARKTLLTSFWRVYGKSAGIEDCEANCNPPSRGDDAAASQIRTFQAILDVLAKGKISMNEVSSALGASRHSIERSVRVVTGQTFRSLQQDLASERATALLNQGKSIKEVAFSLGFASPQAFHRFFLRTCGRTPSSLQQCSDEHGRIG